MSLSRFLYALLFSFAFLLQLHCGSSRQLPGSFMQYSAEVKDSFLIMIRQPPAYSTDKPYHLIIVADGSLRLGSYLLGRDTSWSADIPGNCIVVAIAHTGDWHEKRRRDFIPSDAGGTQSGDFGKADAFYRFLKTEFFPSLKEKIPNHILSTSFIGHSFSGLFCLYTLFREDRLFDHHYAISPSVWANEEELLRIEDGYAAKHMELTADVYIQAGGLELFNRILPSVKDFMEIVESRNYSDFHIKYTRIRNANHTSVIKPAVDNILMELKKQMTDEKKP